MGKNILNQLDFIKLLVYKKDLTKDLTKKEATELWNLHKDDFHLTVWLHLTYFAFIVIVFYYSYLNIGILVEKLMSLFVTHGYC